MYRADNEPVNFTRDVDAVIVPAGVNVKLRQGQQGYITQALGGSFTVYVEGNLFRIAGKDADALGVKTLINPYLPHKAKPHASREEILKAAGDFAKWSKQCRAAGKRFGYHIHGQEFGRASEGSLFDVLAKEKSPSKRVRIFGDY